MRVFVEGIGLIGPGLTDWENAREVLAGRAPYVPAPFVVAASSLLPAAERRRAGLAIKLGLAAGQAAFEHAGRDPALTATVFTSSGGDGENIHAICEALTTAERQISPTRFHNSVHNAPAGYWSIATRSREASTSLCCYDGSFVAGLLDSAVQVVTTGAAVGLIAHDQPYGEPLNAQRPLIAPFGIGLVLAPQAGARALAQLEIEFATGAVPATVMDEAGLEALRVGVPAARSLPLLAALARGGGTVSLPYLAQNHLTVKVTPC